MFGGGEGCGRSEQLQMRGRGQERVWVESGFLHCGGKCAACGRNDDRWEGMEEGLKGVYVMRSSRRVCISLAAWVLPVRWAMGSPSLRRAMASSVRPSLARVWSDIW